MATGAVSKRSAGIVFGFQEFTNTYHLSVSASPHNWEVRPPDYSLGWVHVGITWSNRWGLRFYQNGVVTAESTNPARLLYAIESNFPRFFIGKESATHALKRIHNLQERDLHGTYFTLAVSKYVVCHVAIFLDSRYLHGIFFHTCFTVSQY